MKCEMCKYKRDMDNSDETASDALCTRNCWYFPVNHNDNCHFIPQKRELLCGDCASYGYDLGCAGMEADDLAYIDGKLCPGFIDAKEDKFREILEFWKAQDMYDRDRIERIIDEFEDFYSDIENQ